ncbi:MAG: FAD-dependent oxidoreductase [Acidobacteriota bacterium]|nr:FAD-dependent oxidoreductase [Acidobacteriota bacterium]
MKRIAVIGSGISGLAAAYFLSRKHEVWVFEREERLGGHTNTVTVDSGAGPLAVDTGFIVHNERTYPNFCRLMGELGVGTQESDMSFAVTSPGGAFEYSSRGARGFFAQGRNLVRPSHYALFREIVRFNREAPLLEDDVTLAEFLERGRYDARFIERYLFPMASAIWSMPQDELGGFPALTMIRFFRNHGMLGINTHPKWKTIRGGSNRYIEPLTRPFRERIVAGVEIAGVTRTDRGVRVDLRGRPSREFDDVVFGCHGNQILPLLTNPNDPEREILANFTTTRNDACLHTDSRLLPRRRAARASWNYLIGDGGQVTMTYHMNRLQSLAAPENFCVSLNANGSVARERTIRRFTYFHPLFHRAAVRAQERWPEISGRDRVHYCGAYWFYGFHEDGVRSGLRVAESLGAGWN